MNNDPVKIFVGLGFAAVLALMGLISFISLSQINTTTEKMSALFEETSSKISAANTMRDSIRLRGDTLSKMYLTHDYFKRDQYRIEMGIHALRYKQARDFLYSFQMSAREAKLLHHLMISTRIAKQLNDTATQSLLSDMPAALIRSKLQQANKARHDLQSDLNKLVLLQEEIAHSIIYDKKKHQETVSDIIFYLFLATFFIAIYIAQLVFRETTRKNSEIHYQATHDELTRLVNRKEFNHRLTTAFNAIKNNSGRHKNHALCFLDLDKFKTINDSCGHKAGDELLVQLTKIIKNNIRSHDTLARIGGDEFGLLLEDCSIDKAIEITEGIVSLVKKYQFNWQQKNFHIGVSIGLVMIDHNTQDIEKALSQADIACYVAKDMGRNQVHIHGLDDESVKKIHKELNWVTNINKAPDSNRFSLYLQTIKSLHARNTPVMYEALLRLHDDEGRLISPASYIAAAERFGLMKNVDYWVIEQAFKQLSSLHNNIAYCEVCLFINISANSLNNSQFADFVIQQYKKYNIPPGAVCLEISEASVIKNIDHTSALIYALSQYHIKFAIDDFATDISSFSYLNDLPVDYLKINGDIIKNISHNITDKALVAAINQVGKVMNIEIIAKHVEDAFTLNQLKNMGIDYAQGFHLDKSRPINSYVKKKREGHPPMFAK